MKKNLTSAVFLLLAFMASLSFVSAEDEENSSAQSDALVQKNDVAKQSSSRVSSERDGSNQRDDALFLELDDEPEKLKKLDKSSPIWAAKDRTRVALGGEICLREGLLEFFACRRNSKEHESIVVLDVPPHLIHAALLAIGAKQGSPAKYDPEFTPPSGEAIEIEVRWLDSETKKRRTARAQEFVLENESDRTMQASWVFTGGLFGLDPEGKKYYLANVTGEVFGVSNFPGSVLDVPLESSSDNASLYYSPNTKAIPPVGTKVLLILTRQNARTAATTNAEKKE